MGYSESIANNIVYLVAKDYDPEKLGMYTVF